MFVCIFCVEIFACNSFIFLVVLKRTVYFGGLEKTVWFSVIREWWGEGPRPLAMAIKCCSCVSANKRVRVCVCVCVCVCVMCMCISFVVE